MSFDLTPTIAQHDLARRTHEFAEQVVRPVAADYDARQEFPWPVLEEAASQGFYSPLFYRDLIGDPTGLSLPMFMEELFWGCAGIGLAVVMPALALSAIGQAASPEQMLEWAPECFGTPGDLKLAALAISEPEGGSDVRNLRTTAARRPGRTPTGSSTATRCGSATAASPTSTSSTPSSTTNSATAGRRCSSCPAARPGLEMVRKLDKLGCRASHTAELKFNGVRVPAANLLGGHEKLEHKLAKAREAVEGGKHSGSATLGHLRADPADGRRTGTRNRQGRTGIRDRVRQPTARRSAPRSSTTRASPSRWPTWPPRIDAARLLTWRASWMAATGVPFERGEGSMSKLAASEVAVEDHRARDPDDGRLGLHQGPSGREVVSRRQAVHDLRGHQRDPADRHLQRARRRRRQAAACTSTWNRPAGR